MMICPFTLLAQVNVAGMWTGIDLEKKVFNDLKINLSPELRIENNFNGGESFFIDSSIDYQLREWLSTAVHYRFILKEDLTDLSSRHRYFLDLNFKYPVRRLDLKYRARLQQQYKDIYSSGDGFTPKSALRNKFATEYEINRRFSISASYEFWLPINNDKTVVNHQRVSPGISHTLTRRSKIDLNYVIDIDREGKIPVNTYITAIGYKYSLDR